MRIQEKVLDRIKKEMIQNSHFVCELREENGRFYAPVMLSERWKVEALIDSGSEVTLISKKIFEFINQEKSQDEVKSMVKPTRNLHNVNGENVPIVGMAEVEIKIGKHCMQHPMVIVDVNSLDVLLGGDILGRLSPLIDYFNGILWAQVKRPIPQKKMVTHSKNNGRVHIVERRTDEVEIHFRNSQNPEMTVITKQSQSVQEQTESATLQSTVLLDAGRKWKSKIDEDCLRFSAEVRREKTVKAGSFTPIKVLVQMTKINDEWRFPVRVAGESNPIQAKLDLNLERSYISEGLVEKLQKWGNEITVLAPCRSESDSTSQVTGRAMVAVSIGEKKMRHNMNIVKGGADICIANDILHRLVAFVDILNGELWSRLGGHPVDFTDPQMAAQSDQILPYAVELVAAQDIEIPRYIRQATVVLRLKGKQSCTGSTDAYVHISQQWKELGLDSKYVPLVNLQEGTCKILVDNRNEEPIHICKGMKVGDAVSDTFHSTDLTNTILGATERMIDEESGLINESMWSQPEGMFQIHSIYPEVPSNEVKVQHRQEVDTIVFSVQESEEKYCCYATTKDLTQQLEEQYELATPEVFPGFTKLIEDQIAKADGCTNEAEKSALREMFIEHQEVFAKDSYDCGGTHLHVMKIPTDPNLPPVFQRQYRLPMASIEDLSEIIRNLEERKIIRKVHSSFNTPILAVLKPNGTWRLCADLRELNKRVHQSRWPIPYIDQELVRMQGAKIYTALDLTSGYWIVPVAKEDQYKLAFTFEGKSYCWQRSPFGFINSGSEFNIFITKALPDAPERGTITYVDDVLIKSETFLEHLNEIKHVLTQLKDAGAKVSLQKAQWCRTKVNFLGHEVTPSGINIQKKKVDAILKLKEPRCIKDVRSILGLANYSRKFIENYSEIIQPLLGLLKKNNKWEWTEEHQKAVKTLKEKLANAPCLAYPKRDKEFFLEVGHTDRCLSAVLYQKEDGNPKVISYASKTLSEVEVKFNECEKALFAAVWAVQHFKPFIYGSKIVLETAHQSIQFLNSNKIREGNVTGSRITGWMMSMQSVPVEIRYSKNKKNVVAQGLADLHQCDADECSGEDVELSTLEPFANSPHQVYEEKHGNLPCVFVDGCSFKDETGERVAGIGNVWINDYPVLPQGRKIGSQSSQVAELVAVYLAIKTACEHGVKEIVLITDSIYVRNAFVEYLPGWKARGMKCMNGKSLKHANMIKIIDEMVLKNNMVVYWRKTKGHSKTPGFEKCGNDTADRMATEGAVNGELLGIDHLMTESETVEVKCEAVTRSQTHVKEVATWSEKGPDPDLITEQKDDATIGKFYRFIENPENNPITQEEIEANEELKILYRARANFKLHEGLLVRVTENAPMRWVVPLAFRGIMMEHAHDEITSGHRSPKVTNAILQELVYWPHMIQDVEVYCAGCLRCAQFQPSSPSHRAPLRKRGITYPWSDVQIDFIGPVVKSNRGNQYMLTVICLFTKWVECIPAPNCKADTAALLLINHIFCRQGLPERISSDKGSAFTAEVMTKLWQILGVKRQLHIAYHPASSGTVERANQTIVNILKKYVSENGKDWDLKLPLVLMAIRATPSSVTGYSPFELLTGRRMVVPMHLLYKVSEQVLVGAMSTHDYVANLRKHLQYAFAHAQKNLEKAVDASHTYYNLKTDKREYEIGDRIYFYNYLKNKAKNSKFLPVWHGPYEITEKLSPVVYRIKDTKNPEKEERWVHRNQIKIAHPQSRLKQIETEKGKE